MYVDGKRLLNVCLNRNIMMKQFSSVLSALKNTEGKSVFYFLYSTVLFAANKPKEALIQLETGLKQTPQYYKKIC